MRSGTLRFYAGCLAAVTTAAAAIVACGSSDDALSAFGDGRDAGSRADSGGFSPADGGVASDAATMIPANGIVIVHAADFGAFRLCFKGVPNRRPIPSADLLPESNLLGVDVGSAVRIDPIAEALNEVYAFAVDDIKSFYPPGKAGPTCGELLSVPGVDAHEVANIKDNLAFGVHLLALRGSLADQDLRLEKITLNAFDRPFDTLPVQVLPLARDLALRAGNRKVGVAAGLIDPDAGDAGPMDPFVEGAFTSGVVTPKMPVLLDYDPNDEGAFAASGFVVTLGGPLDAGIDAGDGGDAGPREVIFRQSLADIQRLSAPRSLPTTYFNAASSYVLLLLGDAQERDAAADERKRLHFLAVPMKSAATGDASIEDAASTD